MLGKGVPEKNGGGDGEKRIKENRNHRQKATPNTQMQETREV